MKTGQNLLQMLNSLDGKDYGGYQSLLGEYPFGDFDLIIGQIPKDPYAPPHTGIYRVRIKSKKVLHENVKVNGKVAEIALRDFFARCFYTISSKNAKPRRGTGNSGLITVDKPGQCILERSSVILQGEYVEIRCFIGLPARGRLIDAKTASRMLLDELPRIVKLALKKENYDANSLIQHINCAEDAEYLREQITHDQGIAFIADNSLLARKSGNSDLPLEREKAILFESPQSLQKTYRLPHDGEISGMLIRAGVSLITGGGYHGKSTLLNAIQMGVYNHIPGDGRELVVTVKDAIKVRAYDGRSVQKTDISPFIDNLPLAVDSRTFSSDNASGSTSQAAAIIEAMEIGAKVLIMDEDTSATNFLIRDFKMQKLVAKEDEPITTYIDQARALFLQNNVSTILVLGGIGDYFDIADTIIQLKNYRVIDVTEKARKISAESTERREAEGRNNNFIRGARIPVRESINSLNLYGKHRIYSTDMRALHFGKEVIDLNDLEQLVELSQTRAIGQAMNFIKKFMDDTTPLAKIVAKLEQEIELNGMDIIYDKISGHFACFRKYELAMAINRLRIMRMK